MAILKVDGIALKTPAALSWGLEDITAGDSGRTEDAVMHKNRITQKRKISLSWNNPTQEETAVIPQAFNPEYIKLTYPDAMSGTDRTGTFYVTDRSAPVKIWTVGTKRYSSVSFDLIER